MKFVKGISLFFIMPLCLILLGFFMGSLFSGFFYPGKAPAQIEDGDTFGTAPVTKETPGQPETAEKLSTAVASKEQMIDADTQFLVEEADLRRNTFVETEWEMPEKYIGMNREAFVNAMEEYAFSPPLVELERGFVSLEVKAFSRERVLVRMNYVYTAPSTGFYLVAEKHYIIVYCDDRETLYMKTNIRLDSLPDKLVQDIIRGMVVEDEKTLYDFLESYSS